jgi:hypothetical protein
MRDWIGQWLEKRGGAAGYFGVDPVPGIDPGALVALVEADLAQGIQRERLLFALIMLVEWHTTSARRVELLSRQYAAVGGM